MKSLKSLLLCFMCCLVSVVSFAHTDSHEKEETSKLICYTVPTNTTGGSFVFCLPDSTLKTSGDYTIQTIVKDQTGRTLDSSTKVTFAKDTRAIGDDGSIIIIEAGCYPVNEDGTWRIDILYGHNNSTVMPTPKTD